MAGVENRRGGTLERGGIVLPVDSRIKSAVKFVADVLGDRAKNETLTEYKFVRWSGKIVEISILITDGYSFNKLHEALGHGWKRLKPPRFRYADIEIDPQHNGGPSGGNISIKLKEKYRKDAFTPPYRPSIGGF